MCEPLLPPTEDERDGYEYADDVINELLREIEKVQSWHMVTRGTAVRVVALLFSTDEDKLLRLTGENQ